MIIEQLIYNVKAEDREEFMRIDGSVWYPFLPDQTGFVDKQYWLDSLKPNQLVINVFWQTQEAWDSVPKGKVGELETKFEQMMNGKCKRISVIKYEVIN